MEKLSIEQRFSDIEYNINKIKERISEACIRSGRKENEVRLMAVTKTVEPIFINRAIAVLTLSVKTRFRSFFQKKNISGLRNVKHILSVIFRQIKYVRLYLRCL